MRTRIAIIAAIAVALLGGWIKLSRPTIQSDDFYITKTRHVGNDSVFEGILVGRQTSSVLIEKIVINGRENITQCVLFPFVESDSNATYDAGFTSKDIEMDGSVPILQLEIGRTALFVFPTRECGRPIQIEVFGTTGSVVIALSP